MRTCVNKGMCYWPKMHVPLREYVNEIGPKIQWKHWRNLTYKWNFAILKWETHKSGIIIEVVCSLGKLSNESFPDWSWNPDFSFKNEILEVAGFDQTCSNLHLLGVYEGKFRIFRIFSGFWSMFHFHHCKLKHPFKHLDTVKVPVEV